MKKRNTYDTIEIHLRPTYNLFDNYKPTAMVYKNLLDIETYRLDMALLSYLLQIENKQEKNVLLKLILGLKIEKEIFL